MTTRSGKRYAAMSTVEEIRELLQQLAMDRQKREEEIAAERQCREEEIQAKQRRREEEIAEERRRNEEERLAREKVAVQRVEAMQEHIDKLVRLVEESRKAEDSGSKPSSELRGIRLVPLTEKDDIEAYLVTFERIMEAHKVARDRWAHPLAPQLTGKAQLAFAALPSSESADFDAIKKAVLACYDDNEEAYRRRFCALTRSNGETNREVAVKLMDLQQKWLKEYKNMDDIKEAIGIEQFLNTLPPEKRIWLTERKPRTCVEAGELADEYEQARKQDPSGQKATPHKKCNFCHKQGHLEQKCRKKKASGAGFHSGETGQPMCFNCRKYGHISRRCPEKKCIDVQGNYQGSPDVPYWVGRRLPH